MAAWLIISLIPKIVPNFSQWEVLRAFHALLHSWQNVLAFVAGLIPPLAWVDLTPTDVFALVFALTIGLPAAISAATMRDRFIIKDEVEKPKRISEKVILDRAIAATFGLFVLFSSFALGALVHGGSSGVVRLHPPFEQVFLITLVFWVGALFMLRGYFRGLVFVLAFIVAIEGLYWLNTPTLKDWIDAQVEQSIGPNPLATEK